MLADLKQKAAGVDRKRVYTAAAALLIAGAAGHFMQRTANGPAGGPEMMTASVPAVSAPEILAAPEPAPAPASDIAAAPQPDPAPEENPAMAAGTLAEAEPLAPAVPAPETMTAEAAPEAAEAEPVPETLAAASTIPKPMPKPAIVPEMLAETGTKSTAIYPAPKAGPILEEVTRAATDPLLAITEPAPGRADDTVFAAATDPLDMTTATDAAPAEPEMAACAIDLNGTAKPGALMEISISAPCNSGETVRFEHAGLRFSEQLWPDGTLVVEVPAMTGSARVEMHFADGVDRDIEVTIPDFDAFDRMAVIWQGATGLQLHALENGSAYGEAGHVWADTPGTPDAAINGTGGFVSVLGSTTDGFAADVYTYPAALMRKGVEPEVSIEAQVMENTCGGQIEGWILRTNPGRAPNMEPLTMTVPGCDAVGEYLVLRNLPVELKLARR